MKNLIIAFTFIALVYLIKGLLLFLLNMPFWLFAVLLAVPSYLTYKALTRQDLY